MLFNIFFNKKLISKYRKKLYKIRAKNNLKILNLKSEFSKILHHDIKNALLAQSNCLELLFKEHFGKISFSQRDIINEILSSNKFLIEIINNAILLTEIEEKTDNLHREEINIINQANNCLETVRELAKNKNQRIIFNFKNDELRLSADKNLIQKIISNLLTGLVIYGFEESDIIVSIEENEHEISFSAKNKSVYMTKEKLKSIFDDNTSNSDFNQLGAKLNLNIAKKLINAHDWDFIAKSDKDNTSTFGFIAKK